jgi:UDP-GlcNAc:undecaprenyl-phosphate/decaprenyl-phosphate GlcNAc-1-phosphate transferase
VNEYVVTLLAAAAVTYILTPAVRRFAIAVGAMHAARERDVHEQPTPLLGGFAIYGGLVVALLLASRLSGLSSVFTETNMAKGLLLAGALVVTMGFVDDRWGMGALSKLAGQVAAGVILVWSGAEIPWLPAPGGVTIVLTSDQQVAVTILVVVVTMNAVNFIDGLDGLAAGIVGIGAIAFFAYYFTLVHRLGLLDQSEPALVSVLLAGVCIGFLPHNFYPARIFMGDTGSMLIGLMLAYAPISSLALLDPASLTDTQAYAAGTVNRYGAFIPLLVPAAILLIPYADLLMAVVRRTRAGISVFAPDKKHLQHRLLAIGHSHRTSVLIMYLWAALFSGTVILLSIVRTPLYILAIVTVAAVLILVLVTMPRLRPWSRATAGATVGDGAAGARAPRPASAVPARTVPARTVPARTVPASAAAASAAAASVAPAATAAAEVAPASARAGAAGAGTAPAGPAADGRGTAATERVRPAQPVRQAGGGVVQVPESARGNAARAAIRARLAESAKANGATGNGGGPGPAEAGNGTSGNGAAPAKSRGRKDDVAAPDTPATTPEAETDSPVTQAAGHSGWPWDAADTLPPHHGNQAVPPWAADDAKPARSAPVREDGRDAAPADGPRAVPPWAAESPAESPEPASSVPSWDAGSTAPPAGTSSLAAGRSLPPWELPPETLSAVPPWAGDGAPPWAGHGIPPWAGDGAPPSVAGRSLPPWELPDSDAAGPVPVLPWPGQASTPAEASDGPGNWHPAPPWPPATPPQRPAAPPWPPATPPQRPAAPPWPPTSPP